MQYDSVEIKQSSVRIKESKETTTRKRARVEPNSLILPEISNKRNNVLLKTAISDERMNLNGIPKSQTLNKLSAFSEIMR